eukprot:COSAG02_NODE_35819_length_463_cov_0.500000_1_plen_75_part_10
MKLGRDYVYKRYIYIFECNSLLQFWFLQQEPARTEVAIHSVGIVGVRARDIAHDHNLPLVIRLPPTNSMSSAHSR